MQADKATIECKVSFPRDAVGKISINDNEVIVYNDALIIENHCVPLNSKNVQHQLHIFIDKSVMEVFVDEHNCFTAMLNPIIDTCELKIAGENITATVWELDTKDLFMVYKAEA